MPLKRAAAAGGKKKSTASSEDQFMAAAIGDVEWLRQSLKESGKKLEFDRNGMAAIHLAAIHGRIECLRLLIEQQKCDVNFASSTGWRPVHLCISSQTGNRSIKCLVYLLDKGADHSCSNDDQVTPAHQAASEGNLQALQLLVNIGAKLNQPDVRGFTPLDMAKMWGHKKCARLLATEIWRQEKDEVAKKLQMERGVTMRQLLRQFERQEQLEHDQRYYGNEPFKDWVQQVEQSKSASRRKQREQDEPVSVAEHLHQPIDNQQQQQHNGKGKPKESGDKLDKNKKDKLKSMENDKDRVYQEDNQEGKHKEKDKDNDNLKDQDRRKDKDKHKDQGKHKDQEKDGEQNSKPVTADELHERVQQAIDELDEALTSSSSSSRSNSRSNSRSRKKQKEKEKKQHGDSSSGTVHHSNAWNNSTKVTDCFHPYQPKLEDAYPRDEFTKMPHPRLSHPQKLNARSRSHPASAIATEADEKLIRRIGRRRQKQEEEDDDDDDDDELEEEKEEVAEKPSREQVFKCKTVLDLERRRRVEEVVRKYRGEAALHLISDPNSFLFRHALGQIRTEPSSSRPAELVKSRSSSSKSVQSQQSRLLTPTITA